MFLLSVVLLYRVLLVSFGYMQMIDFFMGILAGLGLVLFFVLVNKITFAIKGVDGFGLGDIWMSPAFGLILGMNRMIVAMFFSFIFGSLVAVYLLATKKSSFGQYLPFAPFMILGLLLSLIYGDNLFAWYFSLLV